MHIIWHDDLLDFSQLERDSSLEIKVRNDKAISERSPKTVIHQNLDK
jgi:hypothetical protein